MRILILGINFHPELTGIGKYTGELAEYLSQRGHDIRIVTAPPYYPYWQVQSGYKWWQYRHEHWQGVNIFRVPIWVPKKSSGIKRLLHLASFALFSFPTLIGQISWRPECVLCVAPAFLSAPGAWMLARICGAKSWLHLQDFELDAAIGLGMLPASRFLTRWAFRCESWLLTHFDRVSTISESMLRHLNTKGVLSQRAYLFLNWVDTAQIHPLPGKKDSARGDLGISDESLVVLYSGNMGAKQGLEIVVEAARQLQSHPEFVFVFCGEGAARESLEKAAAGLTNVKFCQLQPLEKLNQLLNCADIHVLPQRPGVADLVMPSKLQGMLASGIPVLATASVGTEVWTVVNQVGVVVPPGDLKAFCDGIVALAESPDPRSMLGRKGRIYACENWGKEYILARFEENLLNLVDGQQPST